MFDYLDSFDRAIIRMLYATKAKYNTNQIADKLNMSWSTAETHLHKLRQLGFVIAEKRGELWCWRIRN